LFNLDKPTLCSITFLGTLAVGLLFKACTLANKDSHLYQTE
jgi:hypothetical protein